MEQPVRRGIPNGSHRPTARIAVREPGARRTRIAVVVAAWLASAYMLAVPLVRPRGIYGWGHYAGRDLALGAVATIVALVASVDVCPRSWPRLRRALLAGTTAVCAALVTLLVCDVGWVLAVRKAWRHPADTDAWAIDAASDTLPDDSLGFVRKPNLDWSGRPVEGGRWVHYRTDEHGFRNPAGLDRADVVFVGDSFTEAGPIPEEDTFVVRVGERSGLRTANLGRSRYGPQQEELVLDEYALAYHPRAVVWVLFEGNDLSDAHRFAEWRRDPTGTQTFAVRYARASPLLELVRATGRRQSDRPRRLRLPDGGTGAVYLDYPYVPDASVRDSLGFDETRRSLEAGATLCRAHGVALLVVLIPTKVHVLAPWVVFDDDADRAQFFPAGDGDDRDFEHAVGGAARALGIPVVDAFPLLRARAAVDDRLVYATYADSHLEVDGHVVVAEAVLGWLATSVPRRP